MQRKFRPTVWVLLLLAVSVLTVVVLVEALRSRGASFDRWVSWAVVATLVVTAIGVAPTLWEKIVRSRGISELGVKDTEDQLATLVLVQAQVARSLLIGADEAGDRAANVRFIKGAGHFREVGGAKEGDIASVLEYYQSLSPRRLVVLGDPGAGKTVLTMELLIRLLEQRQHDKSVPVPLLISAAAYDTERTWEDWLAKQLVLRFAISVKVATELIQSGRILPIVDGLDEMDPADAKPERANALIRVLNSSMHGRERVAIIATCRRAEYRALEGQIDRATHIELIPLTGAQAADYLLDQCLNQEEYQRWEPLLVELEARPAGLLASQLATPWRLTLSLAAFRGGGDPLELFPVKPNLAKAAADAYADHANRWLLSRYVPSAVCLHASDKNYTAQQVQDWLTALANGLAKQADHGGSATDIRLDLWWQVTDRRLIRLICGALTAALSLPWLTAGAVSGNAFFVASGVCILILATISAHPFPTDPEIEEFPNRLNIRQLLDIEGIIDRLAAGAMFGFFLGVPLAITLSHVTKKDEFNMLIAFMAAFAVPVALTGTLVNNSPQAVSPQDVTRARGWLGLVLGVTAVLTFVLAFVFTARAGLTIGIFAGVSFGIALNITSWANNWIKYRIGVLIAAMRGEGPPQFSSFLDWARQAGLLRVSGVAYQFRHRQLQDWLAIQKTRVRRS